MGGGCGCWEGSAPVFGPLSGDYNGTKAGSALGSGSAAFGDRARARLHAPGAVLDGGGSSSRGFPSSPSRAPLSLDYNRESRPMAARPLRVGGSRWSVPRTSGPCRGGGRWGEGGGSIPGPVTRRRISGGDPAPARIAEVGARRRPVRFPREDSPVALPSSPTARSG